MLRPFLEELSVIWEVTFFELFFRNGLRTVSTSRTKLSRLFVPQGCFKIGVSFNIRHHHTEPRRACPKI